MGSRKWIEITFKWHILTVCERFTGFGESLWFFLEFQKFENLRSRFWKRTITLFVDVALRAASILKNRDFLYLFNFLHVAKLVYLLGFEPREYARSVSF